MEIHHLDGDRTNNELSNLRLLTINEHYDIHYDNSDWAACQSIINRMNVSPEEKSKSCSELAKKRFADGTHHFIDPEFVKQDSIRKSIRNKGSGNPMYGKKASAETIKIQSEYQRKKVIEGIHHLQSDEHKERMRAKAIEELANGTHVFQQEKNKQKVKKIHQKMLEKKIHPFNSSTRIDPNKIKKWCDTCNKEVTLPVFGRFHKH